MDDQFGTNKSHIRHAQAGGFVTVMTNLTAVFDSSGPARLLDLVPGHSAARP